MAVSEIRSILTSVNMAVISTLVNIEAHRYDSSDGQDDRSGHPPPRRTRRSDPAGDPAAARGLDGGLRVRLHLLLRRLAADRLAPPQGAARRRHRDLGAARELGLLPDRAEPHRAAERH